MIRPTPPRRAEWERSAGRPDGLRTPGRTFHRARIAAVRRRLAEHRECCGDRLSYQIVERALRAYDGLPVPSTFGADVAVIQSMTPTDPDYGTSAARTARYLYRAIAGRTAEAQPARIGGDER